MRNLSLIAIVYCSISFGQDFSLVEVKEKYDLPEDSTIAGDTLETSSYYEEYEYAMNAGKPLAVFIVRNESEKLIQFMNGYSKLFRDLNRDRGLAIVVLDRFNPNSKTISENDADIEMVAFFRRDGKWDKKFYLGVDQVREIADRMVSWLEKTVTK